MFLFLKHELLFSNKIKLAIRSCLEIVQLSLKYPVYYVFIILSMVISEGANL